MHKSKPEFCCSVSKEPKYKVKAHYFCMTKAERKVYSRLDVPKSNIWGRKGKKTKVIPIVGLIILLFVGSVWAEPQTLTASYYDIQSLKRDGQWAITKGLCANGKTIFRDDLYTSACNSFPLGSILMVTSIRTGKSVVVLNSDRTNKRFTGTRIDLSPKAFSELANLEQGIISVKVRRIYA